MDELLLTADVTEIAGLTAQKNLLLQNFENLSISYSSLVGIIQNQGTSEAEQLAADNNFLPSEQVFEANEKQINEVYLSNISTGNIDFDQNDLEAIQAIAGQCPYEGGEAVFRARSLLGLVDFKIYNDKTLCNAGRGGERNHAGLSSSLNKTLVVYPNPANHEINVAFLPRQNTGTLIVSDVFGHQVYIEEVMEGTNSITLNSKDWANGLYHVRLLFNSDDALTRTIIILH